MSIPDRSERALGLRAIEVSEGNYLVESGTSDDWYAVIRHGDDWKCGCKDYRYRDVICKHIRCVAIADEKGEVVQLRGEV